MPREYPLAFFEMTFLLPASPEGRTRQARRVLHARLQSGVDVSRRVLVDRGADRRVEDRAATRALTPTWSETAYFADYVLPMGHAPSATISCRTRRTRRVDRVPPARAARSAANARARSSSGRGRRTRRRESRPGVGGGRVLDRAVVAHRSRRRARHPQVLRVALSARARRSRSRSTTAGSSSTPCRACRRPPRRRADAARVHAQVRVRSSSRTASTRATTSRSARSDLDGATRRSRHRGRLARAGDDVGVRIDGEARVGFPTPSRKQEFFSRR